MKITQRKDGRWQKKITLPDGKTKYFYSSEPTERKAEKDITNQILKYEEDKHNSAHNFLSIALNMLENKEKTVSHSAYNGYKYSIQRLEYFHSKDIESITASDIAFLYQKLSLKGYGKETISKTKCALIQIFKTAVLNGIDVNLSMIDAVAVPKSAPKSKITAIDDSAISLITKNAIPCDFSMWAMMLLCTGMRRGELLALQKKDIDFKDKEISVSKSVEYIINQPNIKLPKTENGIRTIPIIDALYDPLYEHCKSLKPNDYVFGFNKPLTLTVLRRRWKTYCSNIGIDIHMHQLRHSYAKTLYRSGVDAKTAQNLLGHSNISVTMDIYTEFAKDVTKKSTDKINAFFNSVS